MEPNNTDRRDHNLRHLGWLVVVLIAAAFVIIWILMTVLSTQTNTFISIKESKQTTTSTTTPANVDIDQTLKELDSIDLNSIGNDYQ